MIRLGKGLRATFAAIAISNGAPAVAAEYVLTVDGLLNNYSATLFNDASLYIPVSFSLTVESSGGTFIPANTALNSSGYTLTTDVYAFSKTSLSNPSISIGSAVFGLADLLPVGQSAVTDGVSFDFAGDLLVEGTLANPSMLLLGFENAVFGGLYVGLLRRPSLCSPAGCTLESYGQAFSNQDGGFGEFSRLSVSSQAVVGVPEPATWTIMLLGFGLVGAAMRSSTRRHKLTVSYA